MNNRIVKGTEIIDSLRKLAPELKHVSEDYTGLLIGTPDKDVKKVLVTLDVTLEVVTEAISHNVDMIITHHSALSDNLNHLKTDTVKGKMIALLLKHDISVYCTHSSFDTVINGVNETLCKKLGIGNANILKVISSEKCYKLVTCVPVLPEDYTSQIRERIGNLGLDNGTEGAGVIGDYSHVCDYVKGIQNFVPLASANPFIGKPGVLESVEVDRLEMIVPESMIEEVIKHLIEIHPYEEVEYDLYSLYESRNVNGLGRIGLLSEEKSLSEMILAVKRELDVPILKVVGDHSKRIRTVAVCSGSKGSLIKEAHAKGADLFITGDVSFHEGQLAQELNIAVIDAGHWATELPYISNLKRDLDLRFNNHEDTIEVIGSTINTEPFKYV